MDEQNKSQSSYLGIIIFLIIFAGVSLGITFKLVNNSKVVDKTDTQNNNNDEIVLSGDEKQNEEDYLGIKDLKGYYFTNNLKIIEKKYTEGNSITTEYGYTYYPVEVDYIEIDGLKDENIEDKINKEIKEKALSIIQKEEERIKINVYAHGNFSNILSLAIYNVYDGSSGIYLNYDLTTGNQIKFEECFVENANIKNIMQNCIYDELTNYYEFDEFAFEAMYKFSKNDFSFYILKDSITAIFHIDYNLHISIPLEKYFSEIAIFNRFVTEESIYTEEYNLSEKVHYGLDNNTEYYYVRDNLLIYLNDSNGNYFKVLDSYIVNGTTLPIKENTEGLSKEDKIKNENLKSLKNKIENLVEYSKNTPDTMHIFGVQTYDQENINVFKLECEKNKFYTSFEENLYKQLIKSKMITFSSIYYTIGTEEFLDSYSTISFGESYINDDGNLKYGTGYYYSGDYFYLGNINSNTQEIQKKDIKYYDQNGLNIMYNEIFARYGHDFKSKIFKDSFSASLWYLPTYGKEVSLEELNETEKKNLNIIKEKLKEITKYPYGLFEMDETTYTVDLGYDWELYQFSYSDDENKIGGTYTPSQRKLTYNETEADKSMSTTKKYFKGKYLHIILKETGEIYQTIEITDPFEEIKYNPDSETLDLGSNWSKYNYSNEYFAGFTAYYTPSQRDLAPNRNGYGDLIRGSNILVRLKANNECYKIIDVHSFKKLFPEFEYDYEAGVVYLGSDYQKYQFSYSDKKYELGDIYYPDSEDLLYNHFEDNTNKTKSTFKGKYVYIMEKGNTANYKMIEISNPFRDVGVAENKDIYLGEEYRDFEFAYSNDRTNFEEFNRAGSEYITRTSNMSNKDKSSFYKGRYVKLRRFCNEECFIIIDTQNPEITPKDINLNAGDILKKASFCLANRVDTVEPGKKEICLEFDRGIKDIVMGIRASDGSKGVMEEINLVKGSSTSSAAKVSRVLIETSALKSGVTYTVYIESIIDEFDNKLSSYSYSFDVK